MTGRQLLAWAIEELTLSKVPDARADARKLLQMAMGASQVLLIDLEEVPTEQAISEFRSLVLKRKSRVPMSHIRGEREFYGRVFEVGGDVLDPRPDTETLIDVTLRDSFERVLDLGTGSGCILGTLLAERPSASGVGTDISNEALMVASRNLKRIGVDQRAVVTLSDWFSEVSGTFDVIVSNPPYIALDELVGLEPEVREHEPRIALTDEGDGLACYRQILSEFDDHLVEGGRLIFEIGATQAIVVSDMMLLAGLERVQVEKDINGLDRVVLGHKPRISLPN